MIVIGPRLTATPEFKLAADWSREQLSRCGLRDARLESWEFGRGWALDKFTLEMIAPRYMPLMGYPEAWSASMEREVEAAPVFVGDKSPEQLEAMAGRLSGGILLTQTLVINFIRKDRAQPTSPEYTPPPGRPQTGTGRGGRGSAAGETRRRCRRKKCPDRRPPHRGFRNRPVTGIRASSLSGRPVVELLS